MDSRAVHEHFACGRPVDAGDHVQEGGLAAARLAYDADEFAGLDLQIHGFKGMVVANGGLVKFIDIAQIDNGVAAVFASIRGFTKQRHKSLTVDSSMIYTVLTLLFFIRTRQRPSCPSGERGGCRRAAG